MERDAWVRDYKRLLTAYNKSPNAEQADVYYSALGGYPASAVAAAVTGAIRDSRGWPSAADLVERCRNFLTAHAAPASSCDVCHGDGWVVQQGQLRAVRMAVYRPGRTEYRESSWTPDYAVRCPQCRRVSA